MKYLLYFLMLLSFIALQSSAQTKKIIQGDSTHMRRMVINDDGGGDGFLDIPELAVFVTKEGDNLTVSNAMEKSMRPKGYEDIDIKLEDVIVMANGKKMSSLDDLKKLYTDSKPGTSIKLGIKRGEDMMIASFDKADPDKLPKHKMVIRKSGGMDFLGIPEVGLMMGTKGKKIVVTDVLDNAKEKLNNADVKQDDEVVSVNDKPIGSFKDLSSTYNSLKVGDNVKIVTSRSGKQHTITFKKPEDKGGMKIIRKTVGN